MATEFEVPFLGSVPIDPAFVELVESGTRPVYPKGTVLQGKEMDTEEVAALKSKDGLFVDKYRDCSLAPLFEEFVTRLKGDIGRIQ
jgi:hypothetical protein